MREPYPGSACAFPNCDCPGETPACDDYETSNETQRLIRLAGGQKCPVHLVPEPCPTCEALITGGL